MKKSLTALFLLLLTLGAFCALWKQSREGGGFLASSGEKLPAKLLDFSTDEVKKILVSWQDSKVTLLLDKQNFWRLEERSSALASASRINGILASLSTLAPLKKIDDPSPEMLRELSLRETSGKDPGDKIPPGILVRLIGTGEKELGRIVLGTGHFPPVQGNTREATLPRARYVKTADGNIYLVAKVFEELLPIPMAYVEPFAIRGMERALMIASYSLSGKTPQGKLIWCVGRKGSSQAFRTIYPRDRMISHQGLSALAQLFSKQMTLDLATEKLPPTGEKKLVIRLSDGFTYELQLYKKGIHLYMQIALSFREKGVHPYPGETKDRYLKRVETLKQRYSYEKQYFDKKTFLVRPDIVNLLLKDPFPAPPKTAPVRKKAGSRK